MHYPRSKKPPYYKMRPGESMFRYLLRVMRDIRIMYPYARVHGLRYYFDTRFRRQISSKRKSKLRKEREGSFSGKSVKARLKNELVERDGQLCNSCKSGFDLNDLSIDHVLALFMGGNSDLQNLQLLCWPCHEEKNRRENAFNDHVPIIKRGREL